MDKHLEQIARHLLEESALCFAGRRKAALRFHLEGRVARLGLAGMAEYLPFLKESPEEQATLYELLTVNETSFFRNRQQFDDLRTRIIPLIEEEKGRSLLRLLGEEGREGRRRLTVLSAGCSTGEEPYSLAMTLLEGLRHPLAWELEIVAGDLSEECLRFARRGEYPEQRVAAIPPPYRDRYLRREGAGWRMRDEVKELVRFVKVNLCTVMDGGKITGVPDDFPGFDLIFCRNVMIYFPPSSQQLLVDAMQRLLAPGGYLFTGDAEPLHLHRHELERVEEIASLIYRKKGLEGRALLPVPQERGAEPETSRVEELLQTVADDCRGVPAQAREELLQLGLEALAPILESAARNDGNAGLRNGAMEVLVAFGEEAVPMLTALLRDPDDQVRNFCSVMLGSIGSRSAVPALIAALDDPDPNVRHGAAEALGKIGDQGALRPLLKLLDQGFWLQFPAISALGELRSPAAVPRLLELLDDELLFEPVVAALQKIGDAMALPPLRRVTRTADPRRARIAALAIAVIEQGPPGFFRAAAVPTVAEQGRLVAGGR